MAIRVGLKKCVYMGGFEVKLPGMGGRVYKFQGSSCVSTQFSSTPLGKSWKNPALRNAQQQSQNSSYATPAAESHVTVTWISWLIIYLFIKQSRQPHNKRNGCFLSVGESIGFWHNRRLEVHHENMHLTQSCSIWVHTDLSHCCSKVFSSLFKDHTLFWQTLYFFE